MKKSGFTLAEVLVTLGIIGVVSAMTVPSLMNNYQRQVYVAQLHKFYNETMQAAQQYMTDKNAMNLKEAGLVSNAAADVWIKTYMKVVQSCGTSGTGCFAMGEYQRINGTPITLFTDNSFNHYVLASGTALAVGTKGDGRVSIYIDTNGMKGPNIIGRDTFALRLYPNGMLDDHSGSSVAPLTIAEREDSYQQYCVGAKDAWWWGCFGKILNDNWQMTY